MLNCESLAYIYPQLSVNKTKRKKFPGNPIEYSQEDKNRALMMVVAGMSPKDAAAEIGCGVSTLNLWRKKARDKLNSMMMVEA